MYSLRKYGWKRLRQTEINKSRKKEENVDNDRILDGIVPENCRPFLRQVEKAIKTIAKKPFFKRSVPFKDHCHKSVEKRESP